MEGSGGASLFFEKQEVPAVPVHAPAASLLAGALTTGPVSHGALPSSLSAECGGPAAGLHGQQPLGGGHPPASAAPVFGVGSHGAHPIPLAPMTGGHARSMPRAPNVVAADKERSTLSSSFRIRSLREASLAPAAAAAPGTAFPDTPPDEVFFARVFGLCTPTHAVSTICSTLTQLRNPDGTMHPLGALGAQLSSAGTSNAPSVVLLCADEDWTVDDDVPELDNSTSITEFGVDRFVMCYAASGVKALDVQVSVDEEGIPLLFFRLPVGQSSDAEASRQTIS